MSGPIWYVVPSNTHLNAVVILSTVLTERKLTPRKQSGHLCDRMEVQKKIDRIHRNKIICTLGEHCICYNFFKPGYFVEL